MPTNLALLQAIVARAEFDTQAVHTRFVEAHLPALVAAAEHIEQQRALRHPTSATPSAASQAPPDAQVAVDLLAVRAPMPAKLVQMDVAVGDVVAQGAQLAVLEAMKMEHVLLAESAGRVLEVRCELGSYLAEAALILVLEPMEAGEQTTREETVADLDTIRADLQKTRDRHAFLLDENRASTVAKRLSLIHISEPTRPY